MHTNGQWGLHNDYSNWANEDKAKDPAQYGDVVAMKAGTKRTVFQHHNTTSTVIKVFAAMTRTDSFEKRIKSTKWSMETVFLS